MDKVNFTNNEIPILLDYTRLHQLPEEGIAKALKAITTSTTGHILFKNQFPVFSAPVLDGFGNFTLTATYATIGVAVNGYPAVLLASNSTSASTPLPGVTQVMDVRVVRTLTDDVASRDYLSATGVMTTDPAAIVQKLESYSVLVCTTGTITTDDYFVWSQITVNAAGALVAGSQVDSSGYVVWWAP